MGTIVHVLLGGTNVGILTLAVAAVVVRLFVGNSKSDLARNADQIAYVAAAAGLGLALISGLTGFFGTWARPAIAGTVLAQNKTLVTLALVGSWSLFLFLRWRVGPALWEIPILKMWSAVLVGIGFLNTILVGSMGGSAGLTGTVLDPLFLALNINRYISLAWSPYLTGMLILLVLLSYAYSMRLNPKKG
jgi:hypothetical protein